MSKHTPGPWEVQPVAEDGKERGQAFIVGANLGGLVGVALPWPTEYDTGDFSRVLANARLIAAAPDLLEALKKLLRDEAVLDDDDPQLGASRVQARAAIAKAEGLDAERGTGASESEPVKCS